jgi:CBS domain-containing protein
MICPSCGYANLPGTDECARCNVDLTSLDKPAAQDKVEASVMTDPVRIMKTKEPVTVGVAALLGDALQLMVDREIGAVLVTDGGRLVGILTERDFLTKVVGVVKDYARQPLKNVMTRDPETVGADDSLAYAMHKMDVGGYRHLPVVDGGKPVGILSVRDVIRHITRLCKEA